MIEFDFNWGYEEFLLGFNYYDGTAEDVSTGDEFSSSVFSIGVGIFLIRINYMHK